MNSPEKKPAADPSGTVPMPAGVMSATTRIEVADAHLRAALAKRNGAVAAVVQRLEYENIDLQREVRALRGQVQMFNVQLADYLARAEAAEARVAELEERLKNFTEQAREAAEARS